MKTLFALALLISSLHSPLLGRELYPLQWRGICYMTNGSGVVIAVRYSDKDIIANCAANNGLTDLKSLAFVYVADVHDTEVVFADTGETVCEIFQLEYQYTDVPSADGGLVVRQSFIFNEAHDRAIGSAFGTERSRRNANGEPISFSYKGTFQFAIPEDLTICTGTFSTGKRLKTNP